MNEHDEPDMEQELIEWERYIESLRDDEIENEYKQAKEG